jgi:flagellar hook-associated protein 1 FlgK
MLTLSATGGNGLVIGDNAANPTSRGGVAFSQFFGLNDLFTSSGNTIATTGLSASDSHGLAAGGQIGLVLKGPQGERIGETNVAVTGATIGDMISALNSAMAGKATFALDANGQMQVTTAPGYNGYKLEVTLDTTQRGTTGESFTSLFGIGVGPKMAMAQNFSLAANLVNSPQSLAFARPTIGGSPVVTPGDNRGLMALQDVMNQAQNFGSSGALSARAVRLSDFAATFYQDTASRGMSIDAAKSAGDTRLKLAQTKQSEKEGVNLDEELEKMMSLQQAYNAGARLLQVALQLYDALLQAVGV